MGFLGHEPLAQACTVTPGVSTLEAVGLTPRRGSPCLPAVACGCAGCRERGDAAGKVHAGAGSPGWSEGCGCAANTQGPASPPQLPDGASWTRHPGGRTTDAAWGAGPAWRPLLPPAGGPRAWRGREPREAALGRQTGCCLSCAEPASPVGEPAFSPDSLTFLCRNTSERPWPRVLVKLLEGPELEGSSGARGPAPLAACSAHGGQGQRESAPADS